MLIHSYGLFWKRGLVYWGTQGQVGTLLGKFAKGKTYVTDFRDQSGIYCLYDDNFQMVYVGQAGRGNASLFDRLNQHRHDHLSERWSRFTWFGTTALEDINGDDKWVLKSNESSVDTDTASILNHIEAILIHASEPPLNRQGGRFGDSEQYLQVQDDRMPSTVEQMIREMHAEYWD